MNGMAGESPSPHFQVREREIGGFGMKGTLKCAPHQSLSLFFALLNTEQTEATKECFTGLQGS